jgi:peptide deformylase
MPSLPLRYYGDPILRKRAEEVTVFDEELKQFVQDLIDTVYAHPAAGMAAPQVGKSLRIFASRNFYVRPDGYYEYTDVDVYINPKITILGDELEDDVEGCLSIPGIREYVIRPKFVRIEAVDVNGNPVVQEFEGYKARNILHENDHINGVLFIDRIDQKARKKHDPVLRAIKKKYNP